VLIDSRLSPAKKAMLPIGKTALPPSRSIALPTCGPRKPDTNSERVKAQKKSWVEIPSEAEIGTANIAGK